MARRAEALELRFEHMVDRSGEHHMWQGRVNPSRGTSVIKFNKVEMTAHRVARELTNGRLPPEARVSACTVNSVRQRPYSWDPRTPDGIRGRLGLGPYMGPEPWVEIVGAAGP